MNGSVEERKRLTIPWQALPLPELLARVQGSEHGLSETEAAIRLEDAGPNRLPRRPPSPWWVILLRQFASPLIYILLVAAVVSLVIDEPTDAAFIATVLVINALLGGYQEWRAERNTRALQQLLQIRAAVLREGEVRDIDAERVVPGDLVWLESGNRVPADARLLSVHGLEVDESLLTGESLPVVKDPTWLGDPSTALGDCRNMAFAGSIVVRGRAKAMVVATGTATTIGQLALDVLGAPAGKPPLLVRMERFTRVVAGAVLLAAMLVACVGIFGHGYTVSEMFLFAVAMAVSAIPEGLPVALTVALAVATTRMARRGAIVRRLAAVEGLGSCTLIASDKTGTLTCNELTVRTLVLGDGTLAEVTGEGFAPVGQVLLNQQPAAPGSHPILNALMRAAVLCNEADLHLHNETWGWRGDPTDIALLSLAHKLGWYREATLECHPQVNEIPFEPERCYAASYHRVDGTIRVFVKGAPERVLSMCSDDPLALPREARQTLAEGLAERGYRVLALAEGTVPEVVDPTQAPPEPSRLTFLGFVGMIDPLRPGVRAAVASCHRAGIKVCMITGDHPATALAIARDLDLASRPEQVVTGTNLQESTPEQLQALVQQGLVFARVSPRQKLDLVEAARQAGHFVAVTGDGVNDAPALRAANIGVAMGRSGTDVARETAELVLSDDNFATIVAGIEEGRIAYDNVRNVIYLLISTGAAEVVLVCLALAFGLPLPLLPVQFLWLNLVTNGIQDVALALEPGHARVLWRKPRSPHEPIFNRLMIERTVVAAVLMGTVGLLTFQWMLRAGWSEAAARNGLLMLMVLFENVHVGNCRSETKSAFLLSPWRSPVLVVGTVLAQVIHVVALHVPLAQTVLGVEPLTLTTWITLLGLALTILLAMELHKWSWKKRYPETIPAPEKGAER